MIQKLLTCFISTLPLFGKASTQPCRHNSTDLPHLTATTSTSGNSSADTEPAWNNVIYNEENNVLKPVVLSHTFEDTVIFDDETTKLLADKFTQKNILNNKKKSVANPFYNDSLAAIIKRMDSAQETYRYRYNPKAECGLVAYDGNEILITIPKGGCEYGTHKGKEGIFFEETKHAEQFLNGRTRFIFSRNTWMSENNIYNEVDAKMFVTRHLEVVGTYSPPAGKGLDDMEIPTQLGYLKDSARTMEAQGLFLQRGVKLNDSVTIPPAYPNYGFIQLGNELEKRTRNASIFGYPKK